jgi:hypothetical protein
MADMITGPNGLKVHCGTMPELEGDDRPKLFADYPSGDLLTNDEIKQVLSNPDRSPRRKWFGPQHLLNQGGLGSCNYYACAGAMLRLRAAKGITAEALAPEWGYMNDPNGRYDRGSLLDDGMQWMAERGLPKRSLVPYEQYKINKMSMEQQRRAAQSASGFRYHEAYALPRTDIRTLWRSMVSAVLRNEPIVIAVHVGDKYMYTPNQKWAEAGLDRGMGNHAVCCDDAIAPKGWTDVLDLRIDQFGSWGRNHGEEGRVLLQYKHVEQTMKHHPFYAVRSCVTDPDQKPATLLG